MADPRSERQLVRFGRRVPVRSIVSSFIVAGALMVIVGGVIVMAGHAALWPFVLCFLLIPAITVPALMLLNTYAEFDPATGMISVNGRQATPLAALTWCNSSTFRGVNTLTIGYGPGRRDTFGVSSQTPFGSPRIERDWMRFILPFTALPRDPSAPVENRWGASANESVTFEQALWFAANVLR